MLRSLQLGVFCGWREVKKNKKKKHQHACMSNRTRCFLLHGPFGVNCTWKGRQQTETADILPRGFHRGSYDILKYREKIKVELDEVVKIGKLFSGPPAYPHGILGMAQKSELHTVETDSCFSIYARVLFTLSAKRNRSEPRFTPILERTSGAQGQFFSG